jgi:bacillithiol biosynthesis deacetylase BshB1
VSLLAIGAHPDDIELGCAGSIAASTSRGRRVVLLDLTDGELASHGTRGQRAAEAASAARVLGVERRRLGLPDGGVRRDDGEQVARLVAVLREVRPRLVLAPVDGDRHPDHVETHHLVRRAVFVAALARHDSAAPPHRVDAVLYYPGSCQQISRPAVVVDVTPVWERRCAAIDCHASQLERRPGTAPTPINAPGFRAWLDARAVVAGRAIGVAYGEAFDGERPAGLVEPLAFCAPAWPSPPEPTGDG